MKKENISSVLFSKTRRAVLALLYSHPDESFYLRQITRIAGIGRGTIDRELKRLSQGGVIKKTKRGQHVYYQANRECPIFRELQGLIIKTAGLAEVMRDILSPLIKQIDLAFIYGSQAEGTATSSSDVDLFIIGDIDDLKLHRAVSKAEEKLSRSVNYTLMSRKEFQSRKKKRDGFLEGILKNEKIVIAGELK